MAEVFYPQALEKIEYDCSALPSGIYYAAVLSEGKIKKYSFVKN